MLASSSLSFKISLQFFSVSLPVQLLSSYNDSRLHNTSYYTFTPYFFSATILNITCISLLQFLFTSFFSQGLPLFRFSAITLLPHPFITYSSHTPTSCQYISSYLLLLAFLHCLGREGQEIKSTVKLRNFLIGAVGTATADISLCHKLEKSAARIKAQMMGLISPDTGLLSRHLLCRSSYLDLLFIIIAEKIQIDYLKSILQTVVCKIFSTAY